MHRVAVGCLCLPYPSCWVKTLGEIPTFTSLEWSELWGKMHYSSSTFSSFPFNNVTPTQFSFYAEGDSESNKILKGESVNVTSDDDESWPREFTEISTASWIWICAYFLIFVIAAIGNLLELMAVWRRILKRRSAINILLLHLCLADIFVVTFVGTVEVGWRISIAWYAGRVMCKFLQFARAFSLYLSSLVLICLTLDRYYAVLFPLKVIDATKRVKSFLLVAWILSLLLALPQCIVFDVRSHPTYHDFTQCTSLGDTVEEINTILSVCFLYFIPFIVIVFSYGSIIYTLAREDHRDLGQNVSTSSGSSCAMTDRSRIMDRAKLRALKLTCTIVLLFIFCWTPYVVMTSWHVLHRESAEQVDPHVQEALFLMVVSNSCANPLVYGAFYSGKQSRNESAAIHSSAPNRRMTVVRRSPKTEIELHDGTFRRDKSAKNV